jgi:hypothetical protein
MVFEATYLVAVLTAGHVIVLRPESCKNVKGSAPYQQVKRQVHLLFYGR